MTREDTIEIAKKSVKEEFFTSSIYQRLSKVCKDTSLSSKLYESSKIEGMHALYWVEFLKKRKILINKIKNNELRIIFFLFLYRIIGLSLTIKMLEIGERNAIGNYSKMLKDSELSKEEEKGLKKILEDELSHEEEFKDHGTMHKFFVDQVSLIFTQMSNGLATVLAVSTGFSIFYDEPLKVAVPALVVGVSSAISVALGFYFFGSAQKKLRLDILSRIDSIVEIMPQIYLRRIEKFTRKKNMSEARARALAEEASKNTESLKKIIAEEEYGIKTGSLGEPFKTFVYAAILRMLGTTFPLVPFFFLKYMLQAIVFSVIITMILLTISGFFVALSAEVDIRKKIFEFDISGMILVFLILLFGVLTSIIKGMI